MAISRTQQAVSRHRKGEKVQELARELGISASANYAQLKREEGVSRCPCCGQVVREGYKIDRSVLKSQAPSSGKGKT